MKKRERKKMMESFYEELQEENIFPDVDEISFRYCENSETYKINNKWRRYETIQEVFDETTKALFKRKLDDTYKIHVKPVDPEHKIKEITVVVEKGKKKEERKIKAVVDKTMNPSFAKKQSKYLEGTLQLRNLDMEMFEFLKNLLDNAERKFCHITDLREKGTSVDIDMTCQHEIGKIARAMQTKFGGILKMDYKLHTRDHQTQKELFRLNATVILPTVKKGEVIEFEDDIFLITKMTKEISALSLQEKKRKKIPFDAKYTKRDFNHVSISTVVPREEAIDPETFQQEEVVPIKEQEKSKLKIGKKIKVVKFKNKLYQIP